MKTLLSEIGNGGTARGADQGADSEARERLARQLRRASNSFGNGKAGRALHRLDHFIATLNRLVQRGLISEQAAMDFEVSARRLREQANRMEL
jgi:hypothetical protein